MSTFGHHGAALPGLIDHRPKDTDIERRSGANATQPGLPLPDAARMGHAPCAALRNRVSDIRNTKGAPRGAPFASLAPPKRRAITASSTSRTPSGGASSRTAPPRSSSARCRRAPESIRRVPGETANAKCRPPRGASLPDKFPDGQPLFPGADSPLAGAICRAAGPMAQGATHGLTPCCTGPSVAKYRTAEGRG